MASLKRPRWKQHLGVGLFSFAIGASAMGAYHLHAVRERNVARREMATFEENLALGMSRQAVEHRITNASFSLLAVQQSADAIYLRAPLEIGSTNWILVLEFDRGGLSAIRYMTEDGREVRPPAIKPDRVRATATASTNTP